MHPSPPALWRTVLNSETKPEASPDEGSFVFRSKGARIVCRTYPESTAYLRLRRSRFSETPIIYPL
jgi:hypothetical protein